MPTAAVVAPDPHEILMLRGAFAGLTREKIEIVNEALLGRLVDVESFDGRRSVGVFLGIKSPDLTHWRLDDGPPLSVRVLTAKHNGKYGYGTSRVLGLAAIRFFDVVGPELAPCRDCGRFMDPGRMFDVSDPLGDYKPHERRRVCREMDGWGDCR